MSLKQGIEYVSSDIFLDVPFSLRERLFSNNQDILEQELPLRVILKPYTTAKHFAILSLKLIVCKYTISLAEDNDHVIFRRYLCSLINATITTKQLIDLMDRANDSALNTVEGISYLIDSTNTFSKKKVLEPGTLRFFSSDLICYWTGKSWVKIER